MVGAWVFGRVLYVWCLGTGEGPAGTSSVAALIILVPKMSQLYTLITGIGSVSVLFIPRYQTNGRRPCVKRMERSEKN